jgi:RHS repeat-associated protein
LHERIEYTPYGELWIEHKYNSDEASLPYRFTGKELDEETKLYYYGARYLDPRTSRWISGDPAMGEYIPGAPINDEARKRNQNLPGGGGIYNIVNLHVFHYAGNNPLKYIDPDGKAFFIPLIIVAIATALLATSDAIMQSSSVQPSTVQSPVALPTSTDSVVIERQEAANLNDPNPDNRFHCDVMAWNGALDAGYDPRGQNGNIWDGNLLTVPNIYSLYQNSRTTVPAPGTAGYVFSNFEDGNPRHMEFYDNNGGAETYTRYATNGITDPPVPTQANPTAAGRVFVPLNPNE